MNQFTIRTILGALTVWAVSSWQIAVHASDHAGLRTFKLTCEQPGGTKRDTRMMVWYPTAAAETEHVYLFQKGSVAEKAEVLPGAHPLILFSHGYLGSPEQTAFLMEELARRGYIVAAVRHADSSTEPNRNATPPGFGNPRAWTDEKFADRKTDMIAMLDHILGQNRKEGGPFLGRIDETRIGAAGHSLGGYTVLGLAGGWESWRDDRIRAVLAFSPFAQPYRTNGSIATVKIPVMLQGGTQDRPVTPTMRPVYDMLQPPKYLLVLNQATHFAWTNMITLGKTTLEGVESGNARLITAYSLAFFDKYLRGHEAPLLSREKEPDLASYEWVTD